MFTSLLVLATLLVPQNGQTIEALEAKSKAAISETDFAKRAIALDEVQAGVMTLINEDKLQSGDQFRKAANLLTGYTFEFAQIRYELILSALASGDKEAAPMVGRNWDALLVSMSRGRRIGVDKIKPAPGMARYQLKPTAAVIIKVYKDPVSAGRAATTATDNSEVKTIVDADQKARQSDWSKLTMKDFERIAKEDGARLERIKQIIKQGRLVTANDFGNAGLVCQHGETFEDYALAHELSVCAVLLGKKSESWLAGASYDRMLYNSGYAQRFATQYSMNGGVTKLSKVDSHGINDSQRKAVVRKTLKEAQDRKWD